MWCCAMWQVYAYLTIHLPDYMASYSKESNLQNWPNDGAWVVKEEEEIIFSTHLMKSVIEQYLLYLLPDFCYVAAQMSRDVS